MGKLSTITGVGAAATTLSAGGVGVWQLYEAYGPKSELLVYDPVSMSAEDEPITEKFQGNSWGCMKRLFPDIDVKHEDVQLEDYVDEGEPSLPIANVSSDGWLSCAMVDIRPASLDETDHKNRIYAKSEFVVKGEDYGWAMGTGMSTLPKKEGDVYVPSAYFVYKLITFTKDGDNGKINKGYGWDNYIKISDIESHSSSFFQFESPAINLVKGSGGDCRGGVCREYFDNSDFSRFSGSGVAELVDRQKSAPDGGELNGHGYSNSILKSFRVSSSAGYDFDFWGQYNLRIVKRDLEPVNAPPQIKYPWFGKNARYVYVDGKGGYYLDSSKAKDISKALVEGMAPFDKERIETEEEAVYVAGFTPIKGLKGTKLENRCKQLDEGIDSDTPFAKDLISLCYRPR